MHPSNIAPIAPASLKRVFEDQRVILSDDADALDRLFHQLELSRPLLTEIRDAVTDLYGLNPSELLGRYRDVEVVVPRQIFCYLAYRYTRFSMQYVGRWVGLSNHTTVLHAVRKIERLVLTKPLIADDVDLLRIRISEKVLKRRKAFAC